MLFLRSLYFIIPIFSVGLIVTLKNILHFLYWCIKYIKSKVFVKNLKFYGDTVIITGCTDGIGKGLTYSLIKQNVSLLLISRDENKLISMKNDLLEKNSNYKGNIDILAFDFNVNNYSPYKIIEEKIKNLDVGILINNVGASYPHPLYFNEASTNLIEQLVNVNLLSSYFMTKLVLPTMIKKNKGLIIYTSSGASVLHSVPLYTIYSSVKQAICSFANSLSVELKEHNIQIQCHVPLLITTKLSKIRKTSIFVPTPNKYSKCVIQKIKEGNVFSHNVISSPYFFHKIQIFFYKCVPKYIFDFITINSLKIVRHKALKKAQKEE